MAIDGKDHLKGENDIDEDIARMEADGAPPPEIQRVRQSSSGDTKKTTAKENQEDKKQSP